MHRTGSETARQSAAPPLSKPNPFNEAAKRAKNTNPEKHNAGSERAATATERYRKLVRRAVSTG